MEERTFYWLPRSDGGLCVRGRDVFLRGSHGHRVWTGQQPEDGEAAYCIILKGKDRDSPTGDIRSFDFSAHLRRLEHTAMEAKAVELVFYSSPDTCRLWDEKTHEKLDKDRFRRDLGGAEEAYEEVMRRLMGDK